MMIRDLPPGYRAEIVAQRKFGDRLAPVEPEREKVVIRIYSKTGPHYQKFNAGDDAAIKAWAARFEPIE